MELFDLTGKTAIVTGSTRGIGNATVRRLVEHGANVVVCGRSAETARAVAEEINERLGARRAVGTAFNLTDPVEPVLNTAVENFGRLDVFVSNAAHIDVGRIDNITDESIAEGIALNVTKNARLAIAAAAIMERTGGGSIMFITSIAALYVNPPLAAYGISKVGLHHLIGLLAHRYGPTNVRVNGIAPGLIKTDANAFMEADTENYAKILAQFPMRRVGKPDEIAGAVVFLASPAGAYATGQIFAIDGGAMVTGTQAMVDALIGLE